MYPTVPLLRDAAIGECRRGPGVCSSCAGLIPLRAHSCARTGRGLPHTGSVTDRPAAAESSCTVGEMGDSGYSRAARSRRGSHLDWSEGVSAAAASVGECRPENLCDPFDEHARTRLGRGCAFSSESDKVALVTCAARDIGGCCQVRVRAAYLLRAGATRLIPCSRSCRLVIREWLAPDHRRDSRHFRHLAAAEI
jgi:hypothetical protein